MTDEEIYQLVRIVWVTTVIPVTALAVSVVLLIATLGGW